MRIQFLVNLSLMLFFAPYTVVFGQESYNECIQAQEICPNVSYTLNNIGANKTLCTGCEDDFNFCFTATNTIWLKFRTNAQGGAVNVNFSNLVFETNVGQGTQLQASLIEAIAPCDATTFTAIGNCESTATGNFSLSELNLNPLTTYYIVVSGAENGTTLPAEATFDVFISGASVQRNPPQLGLFTASNWVCEGASVGFTADTTDCPENNGYLWYLNGELFAQTTSKFFQTSVLQTGDVVSVATDCYLQCPVALSAIGTAFTVSSFPVDAGPDQVIQAGESALLTGTTTGTSFYWTPNFQINDTSILNPIVYPSASTSYFLVATDGNCTFSDEVYIEVIEALEINNTFTPNGDGINDTWYIPGLEKYPNCLVQIFNRWGQLVFQTTGYDASKSWDGRSKGSLLNEGVYFYSIDLRDDAYPNPLKGSVTLVK